MPVRAQQHRMENYDPANTDDDPSDVEHARPGKVTDLVSSKKGKLDMGGVKTSVEEKRTERKEAQLSVATWKWARRLLCGDTVLVKLYGGRYWRTTEQLYREHAELEAVRVVMVHGSSQAVARLLQRFDECLTEDDAAHDDQKVITSIFLAEWLWQKILQVNVRSGLRDQRVNTLLSYHATAPTVLPQA
jgi:hypothetical protein